MGNKHSEPDTETYDIEGESDHLLANTRGTPQTPKKEEFDLNTSSREEVIQFVTCKLKALENIYPNHAFVADIFRILSNGNVRSHLDNKRFRRTVLEKLVEFKTRNPDFYIQHHALLTRVKHIYSDIPDQETVLQDTARVTELVQEIETVFQKYYLSVETQESLLSIVTDKYPNKTKKCVMCA